MGNITQAVIIRMNFLFYMLETIASQIRATKL